MQPRKEVQQPTRLKRRRSYFLFSHTTIPLVLITLSMTFLSSSLALTGWRPNLPAAPAAGKTVALNGADRWNDDRKVTTPTFDFPLLGTQPVQVSPLFVQYYSRHSGTSSRRLPCQTGLDSVLQIWRAALASRSAALCPQRHRGLGGVDRNGHERR